MTSTDDAHASLKRCFRSRLGSRVAIVTSQQCSLYAQLVQLTSHVLLQRFELAYHDPRRIQFPRPRVNHTPKTYLLQYLFSLYLSYLPRFPLFSPLFLSSPPSPRSPLHTPRRPPDASRLALQPRLCTSAQCQTRDEKHPREPSLDLCHGCLTCLCYALA